MNRSANGNDKFLALSPVSSIQNITNFNTTSLLLSTIIKEEDMHLCNRHSTLLDKLTNSQLEKMPRVSFDKRQQQQKRNKSIAIS